MLSPAFFQAPAIALKVLEKKAVSISLCFGFFEAAAGGTLPAAASKKMRARFSARWQSFPASHAPLCSIDESEEGIQLDRADG